MHSATYKRWNNNYLISAITYRCTKILVEIAAQTNEYDPKWNSCSKNNFFPLWVTVFNRENRFSQSSMFLYFTNVVAPNHFSIDAAFFRIINCKYPIYLTDISISKEQLQSHIWVVPLLFQDTTSNDLGYYVSLKQTLAVVLFFTGIELIHNSIHSMNPPFLL